MFRLILSVFLISFSFSCYSAESTPYGKITGVESRAWGMHVQVDYVVGASLNCKAEPGDVYMLDLHKDKINQSGQNFELSQSMILAAFIGGKEVAFHLYECTRQGGRPYIGFIRVRN